LLEHIKSQYKAIVISTCLVFIGWVIHAILESLFFYQKPFLEILITDVPLYDIYIRVGVGLCFFIFGILLSNNLTQRRKAEEELKKAHEALNFANKNLERKVKERTVEIERLLKQKDEFIGQLGHDLKNPLSPIVNLIPLLEKREKNPESKEILETIHRNADYMKNIVVKTIELARLNSPNTKLLIDDANLLDEINNVVKKNKRFLKENNIEIDNNIDENIMIKADKLRIGELFDNIISNAIKYSKNAGTITIDAKEEKEFVIVSVGDTGIGMTDEQLSHIFDEFYKADGARHDFNSNGLGLPICKRIVEKHGGKIWAESSGEGKGTTFYLTLELVGKNGPAQI
jgi:signal transduction histidine kinase